MLETEKEEVETIVTPPDLVEEEPEEINPFLEEDEGSFAEVQKKLMDLLYEFYQCVSELDENNVDLSKLENYLKQVSEIQEKNSNNPQINQSIKDVYEKILDRINQLSQNAKVQVSFDEIKKILMSELKLDVDYEVDLNGIDIPTIVSLYKELNTSIESKDLKKITLSRGRLIRKLKKEDKKIEEAYKSVDPLVTIHNLLNEENPSIDKIKEFLEKLDNKKILYYFQNSLTNIEEFRKKFDGLYQRKDVQQLIFLRGSLEQQLEKHKSVLDERYQNEFLDKKGTLPSLVTVLPNAVKLSVQKLSNSISEVKKANTNRKKAYYAKNVMKNVVGVVGTPVIYFGKFLASNWYTLYMAHRGYQEVKRLKEEEAQRQAEEEARKKAEEEARKKAEEEARKKAEEEAKKKAEEEARRKAEEEARKKAEEEARRKAEEEARKRAEEEARKKAEEEARQRAAEEARQRAAEEEARRRAEAEALQPEPEVAPSDSVPDPIANADNPYEYLRGSTLSTLFANVSYGGNIAEQLENGYVDGDTMVTVTYIPAGVPAWQFWKAVKVELPLRDVQIIWNWSPETNLDEYSVGTPHRSR